MKINYLGKSRLSVVIVLSAASVAFAQKDRDSINSKDIEQVVLTGVADIAKDRKTPVAVSTIKEAQIVEKLGNQEFPEILNTTPSVYATKGGGGFGDGRINIRGFANENIAVMINGVPVNDMENGAVYWSNWAGLSDVTSAMQVQRGLGSSKLAIASVGGTINIITRAADKKREGNVSVGVANDGYLKTLFSYNTGLSSTGWSTSFLMSRTAGAMYFNGSEFEGYNYYFALGYKPNSTHDFQFTFTGAPQWHHQNFALPISFYIQNGSVNGGEPNRKYNSNWGYLNGEEFSTARNYYSKPIMSVNWDWKMSEKSKLSTVLYASWGRGGGTGVLGSINGRGLFNSYNYTTFALNQGLARTSDGLIRFDDIVKWNQGKAVADFGANNTFPAGNGINRSNNGITMRSHINSHDWYGILSNFQHKINSNFNFSFGIDGRYYYGYHPGAVTNFLGAIGYLERNNFNTNGGSTSGTLGTLITDAMKPTPSANPFASAISNKSQITNRNYDGEVRWLGTFGQLEYNNGPLSAFFQGSVSNQGFQRIDHWVVDGVTKQNGQIVNRKTGFKNLWGYNVKGGANLNINSANNVFANVGYYERQPFFTAVYPSNRQVLNPNLTNEKVFSAEVGYGLRTGNLKANVNFYRTSWKDRWQRRTTTAPNFAEFNGIQQVHYGAEFDANYKVNSYLSIDAMFSYGDWRYKGNAVGQEFDDNYNEIGTVQTLKLDGLRVGDAAQTTASLGLTIEPTKNLRITPLWRYVDRLYSQIDVNQFAVNPANNTYYNSAARLGTLQLPSYNLFDIGASYKFNLKNSDTITITGNLYNVFDTIYISEGRTSVHNNLQRSDFATGTAGDANYARYVQIGDWNGVHQSNQVYFGFGRTWAASISYRF